MVFLLIVIATINGRQTITENKEYNSLAQCKIEAQKAYRTDLRVVYADCVLKSEYKR